MTGDRQLTGHFSAHRKGLILKFLRKRKHVLLDLYMGYSTNIIGIKGSPREILAFAVYGYAIS